MRLKIAIISLALALCAATPFARADGQNPFVGSWALNIPGGYAGWLGASSASAVERRRVGSVGARRLTWPCIT